MALGLRFRDARHPVGGGDFHSFGIRMDLAQRVPRIATLRASGAFPAHQYSRNHLTAASQKQEFQRRCRKEMHAEHADNSELNEPSGRALAVHSLCSIRSGRGFLEEVYENAVVYDVRAAGL